MRAYTSLPFLIAAWSTSANGERAANAIDPPWAEWRIKELDAERTKFATCPFHGTIGLVAFEISNLRSEIRISTRIDPVAQIQWVRLRARNRFNPRFATRKQLFQQTLCGFPKLREKKLTKRTHLAAALYKLSGYSSVEMEFGVGGTGSIRPLVKG